MTRKEGKNVSSSLRLCAYGDLSVFGVVALWERRGEGGTGSRDWYSVILDCGGEGLMAEEGSL